MHLNVLIEAACISGCISAYPYSHTGCDRRLAGGRAKASEQVDQWNDLNPLSAIDSAIDLAENLAIDAAIDLAEESAKDLTIDFVKDVSIDLAKI